MAPKRTTRLTPATTTTPTTSVTDERLKRLIAQGVTDVLVEREATRSGNGKDNHDSGMGRRRQTPLPDFNLLSDQEYSEGEEVKAMAETMEQHMSKTRTNYGSGVARLKIDNKDQFELKGQFLKELRENTFSGSDNKDANEHIEKVLEIFDLFHVPNITVDQLMLRVFPISLTGAASHWLRNELTEKINNFQQEPDETLYQAWERFKELLMKCPQQYLTEMQEVILFYNGLDVPTRQILDLRGAIPTMTAADAKTVIQEMAEYSQNGIMEHQEEEELRFLTD
ncbi:reverse transcriptase domain-containing protein [Tanacetum coccineum]